MFSLCTGRVGSSRLYMGQYSSSIIIGVPPTRRLVATWYFVVGLLDCWVKVARGRDSPAFKRKSSVISVEGARILLAHYPLGVR